MSYPILRTLAVSGTLGLLAACAAPPPPVPMPLVAQPGDPCGRNVAEFNGIAGYFGQPDPIAPRTEGLETEMQSESNALERLQIAFGTLAQCRATAGRSSPGALIQLRQETAQAAMIRDLAEARGQRLETAVERAVPAARPAIASALATPTVPQAVTGAPVELRLEPGTRSAIVARLPPGTPARLQTTTGEFTMVDAGPQARGYAPTSAFILVPEVQVAGGNPLLTLAATGAARRAAFGRAIAMASQPTRY